jgi:hypothetical protein
MKSRSDRVKERIARSILRWAPEFFALELCKGILGREPGPKDLSTCAALIRNSGSLEPLAESLVLSNEFQRKTLSTTSPKIVRSLYRALFGREPDREGLEWCTSRLIKEKDCTALIIDLVDCVEFRQRMQYKLQSSLKPPAPPAGNGSAARHEKDT